MARFTLDPGKPPELTPAARQRLTTMTEADIATGAAADPDNPPLTGIEINKLRTARAVRQARRHTGLSQAAFARIYHINLARLRDLEQGRSQADSALLAYLTVIEKDPVSVRRALKT